MRHERNPDPLDELGDLMTQRRHQHHGAPLPMPLELPAGAFYLVDSNEGASNHLAYPLQPVSKRPLVAGDYSIELANSKSLEEHVAVERKSFGNLLGEVTGEARMAMERKLKGLAQVQLPLLVVEVSWERLTRGHYKIGGRKEPIAVHPHAVMGSLISWSQRHRLPIWFCGSRAEGERVTKWWLTKAARDFVRK